MDGRHGRVWARLTQIMTERNRRGWRKNGGRRKPKLCSRCQIELDARSLTYPASLIRDVREERRERLARIAAEQGKPELFLLPDQRRRLEARMAKLKRERAAKSLTAGEQVEPSGPAVRGPATVR